jgi:uncharacterized protein
LKYSYFEWDDEKAAENLRKHGVSFEEAAYALGDPFVVEVIDDREYYGEERMIALAADETGILVVVHTERHDSTRIISARKATRHEQDTYYRENGF